MTHVLFYSHDGYGLGHVRRNSLIAAALLRSDPGLRVTLITGVAKRPAWLATHPRMSVVSVPPLLKDTEGAYYNPGMTFEAAIGERAGAFLRLVESQRPDVVVVDRHPFGTGGELRRGLTLARDMGASLVLGLRDVLDEPGCVRDELSGEGWHDVPRLFSEILVYGDRILCDHEVEYGLPFPPTYCGWVCAGTPPAQRVPHRLAITAGGGGDGETVFRLGAGVLRRRPGWHGVVMAGPYAGADPDDIVGQPRLRVLRGVGDCVAELSRASACLQMAGYNSTAEALAVGLRPVLVPRRSPRREQAIRALRLSALGLADTVDEKADPEEVAWLVDRPRALAPGAAEAAGIRLDGADVAARRIVELAMVSAR